MHGYIEHSSDVSCIEMQIIHAFRTQFAAIGISLNALSSVFPTLIEGYIYARAKGQIDKEYPQEYLDMLLKSIYNSLVEIKRAECNLNELRLLVNQENVDQ